MGKALCQKCNKKCSGEVLKVQDKYFHIDCFKCKACGNSLAQGGFFFKDGEYYCANDYQKSFGTKCAACGQFVEGEVVSALGSTYHQKCFVCIRCRQPFPAGERVTFMGREYLCQKCIQIPVVTAQATEQSSNAPNIKCAGCHDELREGQALIALDKQWHIWCFKCHACNVVLHGEYMGRDGQPYCEKDYHQQFGVKCAHCERFIAGKVLQAGDNHHFHPTCARCSKCGDPFGDGEEMYLQGTAIWHPRCGPGPCPPSTNGTAAHNGHVVEADNGEDFGSDYQGVRTPVSRSRTPSLGSSRSASPYGSSRKMVSPGLYRERDYEESPPPRYPDIDITRIYTISYLTAEPTLGYLKRPLEPRAPKSPQFFRPPDSGRRANLSRGGHAKPGMKVLVDSMQTTTPRPRSPHMNNEEPIELAHYPDARPPKPNEKPKIERDDFPAPPFPYTDPERRRRWSDSSKEMVDDYSDGEDETDDPKLKKEEEELSKIATGIGKIFLRDVQEREKYRHWKLKHLDPRNASRTPSAKEESVHRLRYVSPINASPSRYLERQRPWLDDEDFDRGSSYRSSGRSTAQVQNYNAAASPRPAPKPGYGPTQKSATLPVTHRDEGFDMMADYAYDDVDKTHSTEFSSGKSDISASSLVENDKNALNLRSGPYRGLRSSYSPHLRRSLPNMTHMSTEPPKIYPVHLLCTQNYRLPSDVDRCHLERHLSNEDFEAIFHMSRMDFYRLPEWKRNDMKKRAKLF